MMSVEEFPKPIERSWEGGPYIQVHKPKTDASVKYVCEKCLQPAITGVRIARTGTDAGKWLCASCEEGKVRKPPSSRERTEKFRHSGKQAGVQN